MPDAAAPDAEAPGTDQATTMFRRPDLARVDRPTTALPRLDRASAAAAGSTAPPAPARPPAVPPKPAEPPQQPAGAPQQPAGAPDSAEQPRKAATSQAPGGSQALQAPPKTGSPETEPAGTEPTGTEPARSESAETEPAKTEPARTGAPATAPAKSAPAESAPAESEPPKPPAGPPAAAPLPREAPAAPGPEGTQSLRRHSPSGPGPEAPQERTSRFIALKPLDGPPAPGNGTGAGARQDSTAPVPQRPPLDLLAELTNTPPPPQTPLRTVLRRVKIWTPLAVLLLIVFAVVQTVRPLPDPAFTLTAAPSYTFSGSRVELPWPAEGQGWMDVSGIGSMDHYGGTKPIPIGSVAKTMTAYIVLKDHPLKRGAEGPGITVDALAEKEGGYYTEGESTLNTIKEGDTLTERQALSAIMIPSANNVARLLARWDARSEKAFVAKMNATAKKLGMHRTTYTDPSGLEATTVSTAEDQVKLADELVKIPALMDITKLPSWKDPSGHVWQNYNHLVPYNGAIGIKTGSTTKAGGNLVFAATKEVGGRTVTVVGAVLGQHKAPIIDTVNDVSRTAMIAARDVLTSATVLKKGTVVGHVDDGLGGRTPVVAARDVTAVGWAGLKVGLALEELGKPIPHKAKAGTVVGTLSVGGAGKAGGTGGGLGHAIKVPVALQTDLTEPGFGAKFTRLA